WPLLSLGPDLSCVPMFSVSSAAFALCALRRRHPAGGRHVVREQHDLVDDDRDTGQEFGLDRCEAINERFQAPDLADIIRKEIARLLAEGLGDLDEILDIEPALIRFQPGELSGGDPHASCNIGLSASLGFAELPEN